MNELQKFSFNGNQLRTILINNEPFFVGKDAAVAIGYKNFRDALKAHVKEKYKRESRITTPSGTQTFTVISEPGLYQLAGESKLSSAEPFQDWVYEEVLPTIRKTGGYQSKFDYSNLSPELQMMNQMFQAVAKGEIEQQRQAKELATVKSDVDNISSIVALNVTDWRRESQQLVRKIAYKLGGGYAYKEVSNQIYAEVDRRAASSLKTRLTNLKRVMAEEGASKSKREKVNFLDVIDRDKRLREIYIAVVKDFAIKYKVSVA